MKKLILSLLLASMLLPSFAQSKIDFFDFVRDFDWNMSESDLQTKYKDRISQKTGALPNFYTLPQGILFENITIGEFEPITIATYDKSKQKHIIFFLLDSTEIIDNLKLESEIRLRLDNPVFSTDNYDFPDYPELKAIGLKKGNIRIWVSEKLVYLLMSSENLERNICVIGCFVRDPDFRQGYWGDSVEEIKKKEGKPDKYGMENIYMFDTYVAGLSCMAGYRFTNGILTSGKYIFTDINSGNCIQHYEELVELLTMKYGEPGYNNKESSASEFEKSIYSEGELVIANKMRLQTEWLTPSSYIIIALYGEEYQPMLGIEYSSNLHQEERAADILKDL